MFSVLEKCGKEQCKYIKRIRWIFTMGKESALKKLDPFLTFLEIVNFPSMLKNYQLTFKT